MIKKEELNDIVSSFKKQVETKTENQLINKEVENLAKKAQYSLTLLTNEQRWKFLQLMEEKTENNISNANNELEGNLERSEKEIFQCRFSDAWKVLTQTDRIDFVNMMRNQINTNNKENGIQANASMTRHDFITELSKLLLNKTQDDKTNAIFSRMLIELLMTEGFSDEQIVNDKFLESRLFGIENFQRKSGDYYVSHAKFDNYSDLLSMIASNPIIFFREYSQKGITVGNELSNFTNEESEMLYENVLLPYYEILGLKGNVSRNYEFSSLSFVKEELNYRDEYKIEFTPKELLIVAGLLQEKAQENENHKRI